VSARRVGEDSRHSTTHIIYATEVLAPISRRSQRLQGGVQERWCAAAVTRDYYFTQ
jgi:hypothetical protein